MSKTKTAAELAPGEVILESARQLDGGKVNICVATRLVGGRVNLLALLNKSDSRFEGGSGIRRAWMVGEKSDIEQLFGIKLSDNLSTDKMNPTMINLLNPEVVGQPVSIEIVERTTSQIQAEIAASNSDSKKESLNWLLDNQETTAKRAGKDGDFLMKDGENIFSTTEVVAHAPKHVFIDHDRANAEPVAEAAEPAADFASTPGN